MRGIRLVLIMLLFGASVFAQTKEEKKAAKKAKKEAILDESKTNTAILISMVESKKFVLEANMLYDRYGESYVLTSTINFVGFDGKNSSIQLAFQQISGWNGVGGVTIDGKISKMEIIAKDDNIGFSINATVQNKGGGLVTMIFRVNSDGSSRVDMSGSFWRTTIFSGKHCFT